MIPCIVEPHRREEVTGKPNRALLHFQVMSPCRAACQLNTEGESRTDKEKKDMPGCLHPAVYLCILLSFSVETVGDSPA